MLEILEQILASLSVQDLLRWARVSKRLRKLIYDDARWLARLKAMDCLVPQPTTKSPRSIPGRTDPNGKNSRVQSLSSEQNGSAYRPPIPGRYPTSPIIETEKDLQITAISMLEVDPFSLPPGGEGYARHQYEAVHRMIQPCYEAIVRTLGDQDVELPGPPLNTIQYAHVIGRVQRFAKGDLSVYGHRRRLKVQSASERLEQTELGNFHLNLESNQFSVAKANVQALRALDKGSSAIKQYIEDNPLFVVKESIGDAEECLE